MRKRALEPARSRATPSRRGPREAPRRQAEDALLKAGALQTAILHSATFSSIATDARGVIQIFNVGAERMLGYAAADVLNEITPADISDPEELVARAKKLSEECSTTITPGFDALVFKASRGIEDIYELTYIRKDGSRFPAIVSVTALRGAREEIIGYLLIGTDNTARRLAAEREVTERKRFERALQETNEALESAKSTAEKANLAKSDFLSSMSHELRSPLNAILGFAQLLESTSPRPTASQGESIAQILKAGWHLLKLINEVLDLAVVESGTLQISLEPVSMAEVIAECQGMMEPQAQQRSVRMTFPTLGSPHYVAADRTRVRQVLINLLSNAIKYNRERGTVEVSCSAAGPQRTRVSIRDTGAGLPPEKVAQLFQPFNRLGQESSGEEGTGIGLVMSRRLVERMGGTVGVESRVGEGSVFWFELISAAAPKLGAEQVERSAVVHGFVVPGAPLRTLLYVEDNPANLTLVERIIGARLDMRLLSAQNGTIGVELAREAQPEVILMDINLPGMSGMQALSLLREDPATAHIPVLALSANALPLDVEKGLAAGFFRYLTKPIKFGEFMDALNVAFDFAEKHPRRGG